MGEQVTLVPQRPQWRSRRRSNIVPLLHLCSCCPKWVEGGIAAIVSGLNMPAEVGCEVFW